MPFVNVCPGILTSSFAAAAPSAFGTVHSAAATTASAAIAAYLCICKRVLILAISLQLVAFSFFTNPWSMRESSSSRSSKRSTTSRDKYLRFAATSRPHMTSNPEREAIVKNRLNSASESAPLPSAIFMAMDTAALLSWLVSP